jgi:hypothetical protein
MPLEAQRVAATDFRLVANGVIRIPKVSSLPNRIQPVAWGNLKLMTIRAEVLSSGFKAIDIYLGPDKRNQVPHGVVHLH